MAFIGIFSQIKLLFGPLVIQLVWYILKQFFTSVLVKMVDIYLQFGELLLIIKNWIIGKCNLRVFIGLAIRVYEPLCHALQIEPECTHDY